MLEEETKANEGLESHTKEDLDLVDQLANMSIAHGMKSAGNESAEPEEEMNKAKVLDPANPVFKETEASSKIITVIEKLRDLKNKYKETGVLEKAVVVSQWTSMLNVVKSHVKSQGKSNFSFLNFGF